MEHKSGLRPLLWVLPLAAVLSGCRDHGRQDTVLSAESNFSQTWRATVILRQHFIDGKLDKSPTTFVLLDKGAAAHKYKNGQDFREAEVVIKANDCGPLAVQWVDDSTLKVVCNQCGLSLSAVGEHPSAMGPIRVVYDGFPPVSSWEGGPNSH